MTTHTLNGKKVLIVEVPEGATFELVPDDTYKMWDSDKMDILNLPGEWTILGLVPSITDEVWRGLVEKIEPWHYKNYSSAIRYCDTPTESAHSWLRSIGVKDWENKLILIEKGELPNPKG